MAKMHKPKQGPGRTWVYPRLVDVLQECGLKTIKEYICIRWQAVAVYVGTRPILNKCRQGNKRGEWYHTFDGGNSPWTWTSKIHLGKTSDGLYGLPLSLSYWDEYAWWVQDDGILWVP
jgi:hypothetical protein